MTGFEINEVDLGHDPVCGSGPAPISTKTVAGSRDRAT